MTRDIPLERFAAVAESIDFAFFPRVPEISLELTNLCNLTCPYCANPTLTRPKGTIEWDLLEKIVDDAARDRLSINWLHGVGEPLLWKRLEDVIRLIRSRDAGAGSFATNGTLLYEDRVRSLLDAGLTRIYVSIDTLDPVVYKATRGGNLAKVVDNIKAMIRIVPPDFLIRIALMNHRDYQVNDVERRRFVEVFGAHPNLFLNDVENHLMPSAPDDYRAGTGRVAGCLAPRQFLFINKDGVAALCCGDQDTLHALGDARSRSIRDIWYDPRNQTTFRNIAMGVHTCPSVCTERCVLHKPKTGPQLRLITGFTLSFDDAKARLAELLDRNELAAAREIVWALSYRDPYDESIAALSRTLAELNGEAPAPVSGGLAGGAMTVI